MLVSIIVIVSAMVASATRAAAPPLPPPLDHARHGHAAAIVDQHLCVLGGFSLAAFGRNRGVNDVFVCDLRNGNWSRKSDMPTGRSFAAAVVIDEKIYAIGPGIDVYDVDADRWEPLYEGDTLPKSHFAAATIGPLIYTVGGFPAENGAVHAFNVEKGDFTPVPDTPGRTPGDHFHIVATLNGQLHVIGGFDGETYRPQKSHWVFDGHAWSEGPSPPSPLDTKFGSYAVVDDVLYVFHLTKVYVYDPATRLWTTRDDGLPVSLAMASATAHGDHIIILGGIGKDDIRAAFVYDTPERRWLEGN